MKRLTKIFLKGLLTLLPLALSLYLLVWCVRGLEAFTNHFLLLVLPDFLYIPGMGILVGILIIFGLGLLMEIPMARYVHEKLEVPFTSVPLVKSIYFAIKDLTSFVVPQEGHRSGQAVVVMVPGNSVRLVGLLTRSDEDDEGMPEFLEGMVAVYLPMSYQIGGLTAFFPKEWVRPMDLHVEEVMRQVLTAWMPTSTPRSRR